MSLADGEPGPHQPVKVSVIVPTYCPGAGLSRVIDSLDGQSMAQHEFESVFVDDGSPDDTLATLHELARSRPNMRVTSIPNSGWPSRPRNVGVRMARGDYVVFMDHDDELFPQALEDAWSFAHEHSLDALTAKELKTSSPFFTWASWVEDFAPPEPRSPALLSPMTPHKMYRRQYLLDHAITFPEGGPGGGKVQWEDIHFNIDVYAHSTRLGVLASRPFYHWVLGTGMNNSNSFSRDPDEFWRHLTAIFEHLDESPMSQADADWIRMNNYSYRVLSMMVGPRSLKRNETYYARALELSKTFAEQRVPLRIDEQLEASVRPRAALLRNGPHELLRPLAECDRGVRAVPVATEVRLVDGKLHLRCSARWTDASGEPLGLRRTSGRLTRVLPDDISAALPPDLLDFTDALAQARGQLSISGRRTGLGWPVPGSYENRLVDLPDGRVALETWTTAVLDPGTGAMGRPLEPDQWRVACRTSFAGFHSHPWVTYQGPACAALVDGRVLAAHASDYGNLLFDVAPDARAVFDATSPDITGATLSGHGAARLLVIPVAAVSTTGSTRLPVRFRLREVDGGRTVDGVGQLVGDDAGARIQLELGHADRLTRGEHRLILDGPGETWDRRQGWITELVVRVGRGGRFARVSVGRVEAPVPRRRPLWGE